MTNTTQTPLRAWRDPIFAAIMLLAAFLIFKGLGDRPLWQDEAETANLARNVLKTGVPYVTDGVNLVSQEERREFDSDMVWRWSPWLQIYMSAAGQLIDRTSAFWSRFLFALTGLACIAGTYLLILRRFGDRAWALLSASLLTLSVPFLLFARQGRYYSAGALLMLILFWGFLGDWRRKALPAAVIGLTLGVLFHANYLLLISLGPPLVLASYLLYRPVPFKRLALIGAWAAALIVPGVLLYRLGRQSTLFNIMLVPENMELYFADWLMFMIPLPVVAALVWRWRGFFAGRGGPEGERERFCMFMVLLMIGSFMILALFPQRFHRYIVHFYPSCAIILAWAGLKLWRFSRPSAVLFLVLVGLTNWLNLIPMERLGIVNRPWQNDFRMLTSVNIPLKLHLTEITRGYPDVNTTLIRFFNTNARPGQTILAEYGDMVLQFHTPFRVLGGLQGPIAPDEKPDWVSMRRDVRVNRDGLVFAPRVFIQEQLNLERDYERVPMTQPDETFGNRADPYYHYFSPAGPPQAALEIYRRKEAPRAD
ncbi:ArnT family glycosyltransferase [Fundidesulfovibrio soli]|uniref:ArnT family glycosyltransferase n=1 Tax=Fundidesulfovibrio soli TaxID=2922716 RepID=UPI001FAF25C9|nr:glycosyltransferase [Fundidesulfovibrio soli]